MYRGEPMFRSLKGKEERVANPKSAILGVPLGERKILAGLISRWMIEFLASCSKPLYTP